MKAIAGGLVAAAAFLLAGCMSLPAEGGTLRFQGRTVPADDGAGIEVVSVGKDSPLAAEGVGKGDVITALDGTAVATMDDLVERVYLAGSANPVRLTVGTREVSVVPGKASRKRTLSLGIPLLFRIDGDVFSFPSLSVLSVGTGPDWEGAELLDCLGYWNGPESRTVSLVVLGFGTRIIPESGDGDAAEGDAAEGDAEKE